MFNLIIDYLRICSRCAIPIIFIGILLPGISGCAKNTDCCVIIDVDVRIHYRNILGENLINSSAEFDSSKIRIYFKDGNEFKYIYRAMLDAPNMHRLYTDENGNKILTVYPSDIFEGIFSTTLIELNPNVVDTLVCEFELANNRQICKNAWLNGIEMEDRFIEVIK